MHRVWPLALGLLACLASATAAADGLRLDPVIARIPASRPDTQIWLENTGTRPWAADAALYRWRQREDSEDLADAEDVMVSPRHFTIPPGGRQRLRVIRLHDAPATQEGAYRLVVTQQADEDTTPETAPLQRYSTSVFIDPQAPIHQAAVRITVLDDDHGSALRLRNSGDRHARLSELIYIDGTGRQHPLITGLAGYVLAGSTRRWQLPMREDRYRSGRFVARIGRNGPAALPPETPQLAQAGGSGL